MKKYQISLTTLEGLITFYDAKGDFGGGRALRELARKSNIPLNEDKLTRLTDELRKRWWAEETAS